MFDPRQDVSDFDFFFLVLGIVFERSDTSLASPMLLLMVPSGFLFFDTLVLICLFERVQM
jgi:hypothetical protein